MSLLKLAKHLELIDEHRQAAKITYPLFDVLFLTIVAVIGGSEGWEDIEDFGHCHLKLLKKYGDYSNGIPVHDTIARIISKIAPDKLQTAFIEWMKETQKLTNGDVVAIDGKTLRSSYNREDRQSTIHMVNAFSVANGVVLGQEKTEQKSNEITAIPELLKLLDIKGALVTIDAMGTQTEIAHTIVKKEADFLLAVKGNQKKLYKTLKEAFAEPRQQLECRAENLERQKGRVDYRECYALEVDPKTFDEKWPPIHTIGLAISYRLSQGKEQLQYRYYISSAKLTAEALAKAIRAHWAVENQLHWVLDVALQEDDCQIYREHAAENLARIRQATVNILKKEPTKISIKRKRRRASMDSMYLDKIINA